MRRPGCARLVRNGLVVGLVVVLLTACDREEPSRGTATPVAPTPAVTAPPTPATLSPAATGEITPTPAPTVTPLVIPTPLPAATAVVERTPTATPTAAAAPSPSATPVIEYTELTVGEPRYQPAGYALFSGLRPCFWNCTAAWIGVVRTAFDGESGELLVDNPLASLSEQGIFFDFELHDSGRVMAASLCVQGYCGGGDGMPSDDARQELWLSRDGGETWTGWGALAPPSWILRVTEGDVAVMEEADMWRGGRGAVRWIKSGKVFPQPAAGDSAWDVGVLGWDGDVPAWGEWEPPPWPPALSAVAARTWFEAQTRPDGSAVWYATEVGEPLLLLAVVDAEGAVEDVYGWPSADYVGRLVPMGEGVFAGFRMENGWAIGTDHLNILIDLPNQRVHPLLGLPDGEEGFAQPWRVIPLPSH